MMEAREDLHSAVESILAVIIFENWLRFYFIREMEQEDRFRMEIPEKSMCDIKNLYPQYLELAENLDRREIDFVTSQNAICEFLVTTLEGSAFPRDTALNVLGSLPFQVALQLFNAWVQLHEDQLDHSFLQFGIWRNLFDQWRNSPHGLELAQKLACAG